MKKLKISVNNNKHEIHFDYDNENNELFTEVFDAKGNRLDGHKTNVIMKELIKGFRVEEECLALKVLRKKDSPIVLYTDDEGNINPALFYERNDFDCMDEVELNIPKLKREKALNIGTQIAAYFLLLGLIINFCHDKMNENKFYENVKTYSQTVNNSFNEQYILDMIWLNPNLTDDQKALISSSAFIRDLANTPMTSEQKTILCFQLSKLSIEEYNAIQKVTYLAKEKLGMDTLYGYVLDGEHRQDTIHMLETTSEYSDLVLVHEFIHIAQFDNEYSYLKEASAEIISHEYWDRPIISYHNAVKRVYALMTIVGQEAIWNANFTSTKQLEEELSKYLTLEQVSDFMDCLKVKPYSQKIDENGVGEIDKKLDQYLRIMYEKKNKKQFEEDYTIQAIYNMNSEGDMIYHIEGKNLKTPIYFFNKDKFHKPNEAYMSKKIVK